MKQDSLAQIDAFWEDIIGRRVDRDEFTQKLDDATDDQGFICFNVSNKLRSIVKNVYTGRAFDPGPFILGCEEMWNTLEGRKHLEYIKSGKAREAAEKEAHLEDQAYFKAIEEETIEVWKRQD